MLRTNLRLPQARLQNPRNYCYLNSVAQAFYWIGELTSSPADAYGRLKAGMSALKGSARVCLPDSMQWRQVLARWPNPLQQHDAGEFIRHLLDEVQPAAYQGCWQARVSNPHQVVDEGRLTTPILLHPTAGTLATLIGAWSSQYAVHAIAAHTGVILVRVVRFSYDGVARKNRCHIPIEPGESVAVPIFDSAEGTAIRHEAFRVAFVIFHLGLEVNSGHYQAALGVPADSGQWQFVVCNDNRTPKPPSRKDLKDIGTDSYLIGLVRDN